MTSRLLTARRLLAIAAVPALLAVGCSASDDEPVDETPTDVDGTVNPPVQQGVGGGEPVDNLDDGETQQPAQGGGNSDLDSNNGG